MTRRPPPLVHTDALARYFEREVELGRLDMSHPRCEAHMFVGAIVHYVMNRHMHGSVPASRKEYVELLINLHLGAEKKGGRKS